MPDDELCEPANDSQQPSLADTLFGQSVAPDVPGAFYALSEARSLLDTGGDMQQAASLARQAFTAMFPFDEASLIASGIELPDGITPTDVFRYVNLACNLQRTPEEEAEATKLFQLLAPKYGSDSEGR